MTEEIKNRIESIRKGEIPKGYRYTKDIGIAPTDWKLGKMSDIIENISRPVPKPDKPYWRLGIKSWAKGTFHTFVDNPDTVDMDELYEVKENDLIVNITFAWEHAIAIAKKEDEGLLVSHRFPTYVFKDGQIPEYYQAVISQQYFKDMLDHISPGGAGRNRVLNRKDFLNLPCYIPSLVEQRKIAEVLSTCDRVIELKQQLLDEKHKQKQWLMQILLDPDSCVRLPGFEDSTWQTATISSLFTFGSSLAKSRDELSDEGDLYLHYGDIHANSRYYIDAKAEYALIPKYDGTSLNKTHLRTGDVVFVDASEDYEGISKFVVIENCDGFIFISGLHTLPCHSRDDRLTLHFKRYCFQTYSFKNQMAFYANGMKVYGISEKDFEKIIISFPDHEEQTAIADVLDTISMNIELLKNEIAEIAQKKKALMQLLLTGLVRTNN